MVDVRSDLHARQAEILHATIQLAHGEIGRLHGQRSEADESPRMCAAQTSNVIIQEARHVASLLAARVIRKEHRNRAQHLYADARFGAFPQPHLRVPAVAPDLAKQGAVVSHQTRAAFVDALQADETLPPARKLRRQHVRVDVNASHACGHTCDRWCGPRLPSSARTRAAIA